MNSAADKPLNELVDHFTILLAIVRTLLKNKAARAVLLDNYDSVSQHIAQTLQASSIGAEELGEVKTNLARLRLALDEATQ
jgi:hypothetical protein